MSNTTYRRQAVDCWGNPRATSAPNRFCGCCGACRVGTVDPYTGDVLVEVEVHAVPDDVMGLAPEHVAIEDDPDYHRFLSGCAADCSCCPCCQQVPCAGATAGGFCDRFDCVRGDAYDDHWDSYDDFEQPSEEPTPS